MKIRTTTALCLVGLALGLGAGAVPAGAAATGATAAPTTGAERVAERVPPQAFLTPAQTDLALDGWGLDDWQRAAVTPTPLRFDTDCAPAVDDAATRLLRSRARSAIRTQINQLDSRPGAAQQAHRLTRLARRCAGGDEISRERRRVQTRGGTATVTARTAGATDGSAQVEYVMLLRVRSVVGVVRWRFLAQDTPAPGYVGRLARTALDDISTAYAH